MKKLLRSLIFHVIYVLILLILFLNGCEKEKKISVKNECTRNLLILCDDLINLQNLDSTSSDFGALYCKSCSDYHTRASESVMPFAVAYKETKNKKYLRFALATGNWLIKQQKEDGSWFETPETWTGTTTDQLLSFLQLIPP